jgi:hypothetical protein
MKYFLERYSAKEKIDLGIQDGYKPRIGRKKKKFITEKIY